MNLILFLSGAEPSNKTFYKFLVFVRPDVNGVSGMTMKTGVAYLVVFCQTTQHCQKRVDILVIVGF